jgi:hypothetical protein
MGIQTVCINRRTKDHTTTATMRVGEAVLVDDPHDIDVVETDELGWLEHTHGPESPVPGGVVDVKWFGTTMYSVTANTVDWSRVRKYRLPQCRPFKGDTDTTYPTETAYDVALSRDEDRKMTAMMLTGLPRETVQQILARHGATSVRDLLPEKFDSVIHDAMDATMAHHQTMAAAGTPQVRGDDAQDTITVLRERLASYNRPVPVFSVGQIVRMRSDVYTPYSFSETEPMIVAQTDLNPLEYPNTECTMALRNTIAIGRMRDGDFNVNAVDPRFFEVWEGESDVSKS